MFAAPVGSQMRVFFIEEASMAMTTVVVIMLAWTITAALFVSVILASYIRDRRDRRDRIATRLASVASETPTGESSVR